MKKLVLSAVVLVLLSSAAWSASGDLWPKWVEKEKIRGAYDYDHSVTRDFLAKLKAHGINTILLSWDGDVDRPEAIKTLKQQADWCKELGLRMLVVVKLCGAKDQSRYLQPEGRCYVSAVGNPLAKTPCPADPVFWGKVVTRRGKMLADFARARPAIVGMVIDDEMYAADNANFPSYCYCEWCAKDFSAVANPPRPLQKGNKTYDWLEEQGLLEKFQKWQEGAVEANARVTEQTTHKIVPNFILGCFHLDQLSYPRPSWARGLGTTTMPALALPESTYPSGATPYLTKIPGMIAAVGAHAKFAPGIWPRQFAVENLAGQLFYSSQGPAAKYGPQESVGYWMFTTYGLAHPEFPPESDYALPLPHEPWWNAIKAANDELDQQAREGEAFVPKLELKHKQDSPQVALEKIDLWGPAKISLKPLDSGKPKVESGEQTELARLRYQSVYYILAKAGEPIRVTMRSSRSGDGQQQPVYAVFAPSGKMVAQGNVEPDAYSAVDVAAPEDGLYKLALSIEQHATSVEIENRFAVVSLAEEVCMVQSSPRLYFYVPSDVEQFTVQAATPYALEQVKLLVFAPDGSQAATAESLDLTPAKAVVDVKPEQRGKVWSFQPVAASRGQYYSANVTLSANLPQYLAQSPEAMLVPVSE